MMTKYRVDNKLDEFNSFFDPEDGVTDFSCDIGKFLLSYTASHRRIQSSLR
jgi:hypothetical protein